MDKGIRINAINKFKAEAPSRVNDRKGNTVFRKNVMGYLMEEFGITLASAATHYNHAFITVKASNPELVEGLGRPEDKKGGRKPKAKVDATAETPAAEGGDTAEAAPAADTAKADEAPAEDAVPAAKLYTVTVKKTGDVVAKDVAFFDACAMVTKAKSAKKATLVYAEQA